MTPKLESTAWDPNLELEILNLWEQEKLFRFKPKVKRNLNFVMDTPPPYPSGKPWHPGALTQYSQIDMVARSARMRGLSVLYPIGIDRNGLPIEIMTERKYRIQMRKTPREHFISLCKHALDELEEYMVGLLKKIGVSADFDNKYRTDSDEYRRLTQWSFIEMWNRGLIYVATRPNNYCVDCGTTIADAEIEYEELPAYLVTNKFAIKDSGEEILVSTTRPELLAACQMLAVNPSDNRYLRFVGKTAVVPLYNKEVPIKTHKSVDPSFGTGVVMVCSYGDLNDVQLFREFKLKEVIAIGQDGKMTEITGKYAGLTVKDARSQIIEDLQKMGIAVKVEQIRHRTPLCERSHTPVEIIPMEEFYLKQLPFKEKVKKISKGIIFHPEMHRQILINWIDGLSTDYPISRRRYYATEIPVWYCSKCNTPHVPRPTGYFRPWRDPPPFKRCKNCGNTKFIGETRTFDTWMDSSLTPLFITRFTKSKRLRKLLYPATIRLQGKDIVRTWLYYTILRCYLLTKKVPFKHAWIGGLGLDAQGRAMRKSLGNFVDPGPLLEKYGSDSFRFWGASEAGLGYDFRLSEDRIAGAKKFLTKVWNTARLISSFPQPDTAELQPTDKWILSELYRLCEECISAYEQFNVFVVANKIREFVWNQFTSHYIEMVKPRAYGEGFSLEEQEAAWYTMHYVLKTLLLLLAPITPFITDYIWRKIYSDKSIHLECFPRVRYYGIDEKVGEKLIEFNNSVWKAKKDKGLALKDSISYKIPDDLKQFAKDLTRMHNLISSIQN
jgi:valyl-tRNA synthetase